MDGEVKARPREIRVIAREIQHAWEKQGKGVHFAARPYLSAMYSLGGVQDSYGMDDAKSIVLYFLSNATSFRGEDAKRLKAELKELIK